MELVANDTSDYYGNSRSEHEIDQLCRVSNCLTHTMFSQFVSMFAFVLEIEWL